MTNVVDHPRIPVAAEIAVANLPEAQRLQEAIYKAMQAYVDFLLHHGLVVTDMDNDPRLVSTALIALNSPLLAVPPL